MSHLLTSIFAQLLIRTRNAMPYDDASKLYRVVPYYCLQDLVDRDMALRLVDKYCFEDWTTEMFSWLTSILVNPLLYNDKHILYSYPSLLPLFRAHYHLNKEDVHFTANIRRDFPIIFEEYTPTLEEHILLSSDTTGMYGSGLLVADKSVVNSYFFKNLLANSDTILPESHDLYNILTTLAKLRDCGLSNDRFKVYVQQLTYVFRRVMRAFLYKNWDLVDLVVIGQILSLHPKYKVYSEFILKYANYARIAYDKDILRYLLNISPDSSDTDEALYYGLDIILSNLNAYEKKLIKYNKGIVSKYIRECDFKLESDVKEEVYSYASSELVLRVEDYRLQCYTRLDRVLEEHIYSRLATITDTSPIKKEVVDSVGLNISKLFQYYSKPDYYRGRIDNMEASIDAKKKCNCGDSSCTRDFLSRNFAL